MKCFINAGEVLTDEEFGFELETKLGGNRHKKPSKGKLGGHAERSRVQRTLARKPRIKTQSSPEIPVGHGRSLGSALTALSLGPIEYSYRDRPLDDIQGMAEAS